MILPGETEAGSAGMQPCRGIPWRAHRDDDRKRGNQLLALRFPIIGSKDPDALKIPARRAEFTLTENASSPFHAEPAHEQVVGYYNTGDRMKYWGKMGAFWGGIWGWLFGAAFFMIPGIGPILIAGPLVAWIVGALEGAVLIGGLSALGAGLYSIGIPKDSVVKYETALKSDKFLLMAHGTADEVAKARDIMQATHPVEVTTHAAKREQLTGVSGR